MRVDARKMTADENWTWRAYRGTVRPNRRIVCMVWADDSTHEWSPHFNDNMPPFRARRIVIDPSARIVIVNPEEEEGQEVADAIAAFKGKVSKWMENPAEVSDHRLDVDPKDRAPDTADVATYRVGAVHELPLRRRM